MMGSPAKLHPVPSKNAQICIRFTVSGGNGSGSRKGSALAKLYLCPTRFQHVFHSTEERILENKALQFGEYRPGFRRRFPCSGPHSARIFQVFIKEKFIWSSRPERQAQEDLWPISEACRRRLPAGSPATSESPKAAVQNPASQSVEYRWPPSNSSRPARHR
jgi:hypothetical protein